MNNFGALLRQYVDQQGYSIRQFAQDTNINRGLIYYIFNGERNLSEEALQDIFAANLFSADQEEKLRQAFYTGLY